MPTCVHCQGDFYRPDPGEPWPEADHCYCERNDDGQPKPPPVCAICDGTEVVCISEGGDPDKTYDVPCECVGEPEEDTRTAEEERDNETFDDIHGGGL